MKWTNSNEYLSIDEYAPTPKYIQLTNSILSAIEAGYVNENDILPSICDISNELEVSRHTIEKAYRNLKNIGVVGSNPGKSFYIMNTNFRQKSKVCLLFNKLSPYKKLIYDSFITAVGEGVATDLCIYNNDFTQFKHFLTNKKDEYSHIVVMPHFDSSEKACELIDTIPKHKLVIVGKLMPGITGDYAAVYEDFENDIYDALKKAINELRKYHTIKLLFPDNNYYPREIVRGFFKFCRQYDFKYALVPDIEVEPITEGQVYINLIDDDIVTLIERILAHNFIIGKQVGLISYNETPIKKVILNGVTTISTDFSKMGSMAAKLILEESREQMKVPFHLTLRSTI